MNKHIDFAVVLILVVVLGLGTLIGVAAGTFLFDLQYPEASDSVPDGTSDTESTSDSQIKSLFRFVEFCQDMIYAFSAFLKHFF